MSTRISKDIGYFVNVKKANKLLKKNWLEKMDDFYGVDNNVFLSDLKKEVDVSADSDKGYINYLLSTEKWVLESLITPSYDFDTLKGVIFKTPVLESQRRFDDSVDYYSEPDVKYKINDFFRPIYPRNGYVYTGGINDLEVVDKVESLLGVELKVGTLIEGRDLGIVLRMMGFSASNNTYGSFVKQIKKSKVLVPDVEPLVYMIAKVSGILKEEVSECDFRTTVRPAIITSWG